MVGCVLVTFLLLALSVNWCDKNGHFCSFYQQLFGPFIIRFKKLYLVRKHILLHRCIYLYTLIGNYVVFSVILDKKI